MSRSCIEKFFAAPMLQTVTSFRVLYFFGDEFCLISEKTRICRMYILRMTITVPLFKRTTLNETKRIDTIHGNLRKWLCFYLFLSLICDIPLRFLTLTLHLSLLDFDASFLKNFYSEQTSFSKAPIAVSWLTFSEIFGSRNFTCPKF